MIRNLFAIVLLLLGYASCFINVRENLGLDRILKIEEGDWNQKVHTFLLSVDADIFGPQEDNSVHLRLSPEGIERASLAGIQFSDATAEWLSHFDEILNDPNLFCSETPEKCASRGLNEFYDNYQSLDAINSRIAGLVSASSIAVKKVIGQSYEGRNIEVIEIGNDGIKPIGFLFCTIHAREWLTPMFCTYLIETFLTEGHPLLDTYAFSIVPVANPDGYDYSTKRDNLWRKTRKPNPGSSCVGTDGNRNWDDNHCGVGSSTNPCSQTYCGRAPFDQSEVASLNNYASSNKERIMAMMDIHSYGGYVIHPFGYTEVLPPVEDYTRMRQCAAAATGAAESEGGLEWRYGTTPQVLGYSSGGTSKDYFYASLGTIYPYTVELRGPNFQPRPSNIKLSNAEAFALVVGVFDCTTDIEINGNLPDLDSFCVDEKDSGVYFADSRGVLSAAQCSELEPFCDVYTTVANNCRRTCGCFGRISPVNEEEPIIIDNSSTNSTPQFVFGSLGVVLIVGIALVVAGAYKRAENGNEGGVITPTV